MRMPDTWKMRSLPEAANPPMLAMPAMLAACVVAVQAVAPGLEFLCGLGAADLDALIDSETRATTGRHAGAPDDSHARLLRAALAAKQAHAKGTR